VELLEISAKRFAVFSKNFNDDYYDRQVDNVGYEDWNKHGPERQYAKELSVPAPC
jgi:hypothetical protein